MENKQNETKWKIIKVHPSWFIFIKYCQELKFGEIAKLRIQNGLPTIAEEVKKKIKFTSNE